MSEKSSTTVFQPVEPVRKTSRLPRIFSLLLGLSAFYAIFSLISIELKGRASRVKSRDEWSSLFVSHPYVPSTSGDARSPCPALNTLANHGFIPHDGRNITPNQLFDAIVKIGLNPLPSHGIIGLAFSQLQLAKPDDHFWTQFTSLKTLDLDRLTVYGVLEHDVSLSRNDTALTNSTSRVNPDYVERMIKSASGGVFTRQNEHDFRKTRWLESLRDNKRLNLKLLDQIASAAECSLLMELLGRNGAISTDHLKSFLLEERIPDDWYPQETSLLSFGSSVVKCLYGVRHSKATLH